MSDWVKAWDEQRQAEIDPVGKGELSIAELAAQFGICRDRARDRANAMVAAGAAEKVFRKVQAAGGQIRRAPHYRLKK
jgi:hypothetical protein